MASPENFYNRSLKGEVQEGETLSAQAYIDHSSFNRQPVNGSIHDVSTLGFPSAESLLPPQPGSARSYVGQSFDGTRGQIANTDPNYWQEFQKSLAKELEDLPSGVRRDVNKHFLADARSAWKDNASESGQLNNVNGFFDDLKQRITDRVGDDLDGKGNGSAQADGHGKRHWHGGHHRRGVDNNSDSGTNGEGGDTAGSAGSEGNNQSPRTRRRHGHAGHRTLTNTNDITTSATASEASGLNASDTPATVSGVNASDTPATVSGVNASDSVAGNNQAIAGTAESFVGQQLWTNYADTQNGLYGCAASVSEVLQQSGYSYANSESVVGLQQQLQANGWTATSTPQPGDVALGYRTDPGASGGDGAHTGIVGANDTVYNNVYPNETWQASSLSLFNRQEFPAGVIYLQPPA